MKHCSRCDKTKPLTEFHKNRTRKDGHHCFCKTCACAAASSSWGKLHKKPRKYDVSYPTKVCAKCKIDKDKSAFNKLRASRDGFQYICRECSKSFKHEYAKKHHDKQIKYAREYRIKYADKRKQSVNRYIQNNLEKVRERGRENYRKNKVKRLAYSKKYRQEHKALRVYYTIMRRKDVQLRTPKWLAQDDFNKIKAIYKEAQRLSLETGITHHVDHIIPLRGKEVSGLHVPKNLRVVPWYVNVSKNNKFQKELLCSHY